MQLQLILTRWLKNISGKFITSLKYCNKDPVNQIIESTKNSLNYLFVQGAGYERQKIVCSLLGISVIFVTMEVTQRTVLLETTVPLLQSRNLI